VLRGLETLIGLAPGEVARRRLMRHPDLLAPAALAAPDIAHPGWAALVDAVTIQETRLFRTPAQLDLLRIRILPELLAAAHRRGDGRLRLLSAGCATGEEAWTLAAIAQDALGGARGLVPEVVGLDLSRPALRMAVEGRFADGPPDPLRDVPARFRPSFPATPGGFAVLPALRRMVRFERANLLDLDGPPRFDVILCRNVGIYLTSAARGRVAMRLARLLHPGGALLLGATDAVPPGAGLAPWDSDTVAAFRADRSDD
jgi:chemotaxis protein methyltransferase CheR